MAKQTLFINVPRKLFENQIGGMTMQANVLARTLNMDRTAWLELRNKGIGGSDAAAIAGLSKYKSPVAVYLEKTGQLEQEEAGETAYFGNKLEALVA
ncbi:YqaJ viral recombinase family protein, partial [Acinetobacter baumannii]|uniref:YqaJ viral recombinase family protein n=1 Tax=Acinetobacter baumannii TaxID=470 RepID=UPI001F0B24AD